MPIDPNLIGNTMANWQRPPVYDPLAQYAKIQALKNGITQQAIQQQQLQGGALDLQEKQDQISGQKALADAIRANVTAGADGTPTINHQAVVQALGASGHGELINGYMNGVAKQDADKAATTKVQLENRLSSLDLATRAFDAATDQNGWDHALAAAHGLGVDTGALGIPAVFSPEAKTAVINFGLTAKDKLAADAAALTAKTKQDTEARNAQKERDQRFINAVGAAGSQQALDALRQPALASDSGISPAVVGAVPSMFSPTGMAAYKRSQITPEQSIQADQAAQNEKDAEAARKIAQENAAARLKLEQQNAELNAKKFALEFGGDAVKGWAKQVADNPDTANQVPPALRTQVMAAHTALTGLPFPKPLTGTAVDQERASRNALDAVAAVKEALADPEIQARVGPILGRLGSAEQSAGTAIGLSPQATAKAQQLRTNMRYLVFQEGKALLGGRMPQQLMQQLEESSPNVAMDAGTLNGALAGVTDAAGRNLDQTFKQRYGEQAQRQPAWKTAARAASVGATIPLPDGRKALKTGDNQFQIVP